MSVQASVPIAAIKSRPIGRILRFLSEAFLFVLVEPAMARHRRYGYVLTEPLEDTGDPPCQSPGPIGTGVACAANQTARGPLPRVPGIADTGNTRGLCEGAR